MIDFLVCKPRVKKSRPWHELVLVKSVHAWFYVECHDVSRTNSINWNCVCGWTCL